MPAVAGLRDRVIGPMSGLLVFKPRAGRAGRVGHERVGSQE
jgi:hypothetical protein